MAKKLYRRGKLLNANELARMFAKSSSGRIYWSLAKRSATPVFNKTAVDWTIAQMLYINWCIYYDSIYEAFNRPPDDIVMNDEKIDEWVKFQSEQREFDHQEDYYSTGFKGAEGHRSAYSHSEVYENF